MDKVVAIDTNLYLDDSNIIYKLSSDGSKILIPLTVLKELDKHKRDKDLSYSARMAIHSILNFKSTNKSQIIFDAEKYSDIEDPDDRIIESAKKYNATLATKDVSMSISSDAIGVDSILHDMMLSDIFDPYIHVNIDMMFSNGNKFSFKNDYSGDEYYKFVDFVEEISSVSINKDSWWFLIINNNNKESNVYAHNPITLKIERIDNKPQYRKMSIDKDKDPAVKAMDVYQMCAIYAMKEAPNALICGSYGSGKSLLATMYALANNDNKTFISRPNITVDRRFELGFLPGTINDKLSPWMAGFISSLYYIFSNTRGQMSDKMLGTYDYVREQVFERYFEMVPLETLQGMSFMDGDLLLLDEAQLCSVSILSVILSRFGKGSKLIMTGDIKQTYNVIPPSENGLLKLLRLLPNKYMAFVELKNNYRSELLELANELQNKTL